MNLLRVIITTATLFLIQPICEAADERILPAEWAPSLESIEENLSLDGNRPQQELNRVSRQLSDLRDAQLFILYFRLLDSLDASKRAALLEEQSQWIQTRKTKARDAIQSKGGSLEALEYSGSFRETTEQRIKQLTERLAALKAKAISQKEPEE